MKRITIFVLALISLVAFTTFGFAQTAAQPQATATKKAEAKLEVTKGKIISINTAKNEVVVKDDKSGLEKAFSVSADQIAGLKAGQDVRVKTKAGSNVAENIKPAIKKHKAMKK